MSSTEIDYEAEPSKATSTSNEVTTDTSEKLSRDKAIPLEEPVSDDAQQRDWRFWMIFFALSVTGILSAVEATVISTALPSIVHDLNIGNGYAWIVNVYLLTSMIVQPLFGQLADVFGRRWLMISAVALLVLGSGISGGAVSGAMLIGGRAIQGVGGGGINMLIELIICDLVPLRERPKFMGVIMSTFTIGSSMGPFIGGIIVERTSWRWVFYLNLPIGGVALVLLIAFLQVHYNKKTTFAHKMKRIDWIGNLILVPSLVAILVALTNAGTKVPWSSWRIILPLVLGLLGMIAFAVFEWSDLCPEPTMPARLFSNRTTITALILCFIQTIASLWPLYFLPIYFQAVLGSSPARSGVQILPLIIILLPFAVMGGLLLTKTGRYRPLQQIGYAMSSLGFGLTSRLTSKSSTAEWVVFQAVVAAGIGIPLSATLPAIQAGLSDADSASSTATFAFVRSFGAVWGLTIPATIFNNQFNHLSYQIEDPSVRVLFADGQAYSRATKALINDVYNGTTKDQIVGVYQGSLKLVWLIAIAFTGGAFLLAFAEKEIKLRTELKTEYGVKKDKTRDDSKTAV